MSKSEMKPWDRFCEFAAESTRIFKAFSMALDAKKLMFAFCGVVIWAVGAMLVNVLPHWLIPIVAGLAAIALVFVALAKSDVDVTSSKFLITLGSSILAIAIVVSLLVWVGVDKQAEPGLLLNIYRTAWTLAVAAFFGTAICRIAAMDAATEEAIGAKQAARFAFSKLATSIWTLLTPVIAVVAFGIVLLVVGAIARIDYVGYVWYILIGLLYLVALLGGLFFAVVVLVYIPGLVLFQPAIGAEGNDSFDAISRTYSFVFGRPWRLAFYGIVSTIYAKIVLSVVAVVFAWAGRITNVFLAEGAGSRMAANTSALDLGAIFGMSFSTDPAGNVSGAAGYVRTVVTGDPLFGPFINAGRHILGGNVFESFKAAGEAGGKLIVFWQYILLAIFMAFAVSLIYSIFTQVYFLMRKACDGTPFEEIYMEAPEEEAYAEEFPEKDQAAEEAKPAEETDGPKAAEEAKPAEETDGPKAAEKPSAPKPKKKRAAKKKAEKDESPIDLAGGEEKTGEDAEK